MEKEQTRKDGETISAKKIAKNVNQFLAENKIFVKNEMVKFLKKEKCPYYFNIPSYLERRGKIALDDITGNIRYFIKTEAEPIHYSWFIDATKQIRNSIYNKRKTDNTQRNLEHDYIKKNNIKKTEVVFELKDYTDYELKQECNKRGIKTDINQYEPEYLVFKLREWGYEVKATKTIEL